MDPGEEMNIAKAHFMKYSENYEKQTNKQKKKRSSYQSYGT